MSRGTLIALGAVLSAAATVVATLRLRHLRGPRAPNFRGEPVPQVLGLAITIGLTMGVVTVLLVDADRHLVFPSTKGAVEILATILLVCAGGLQDDLQPASVHGLVAHVRELFRGRVTSGIAKMAVAVVAATAFCWVTRDHGVPLALGVPFVSGAANLWNLLDVVPGRAIKFFVPAAGVAFGLAPQKGLALFEAAALGGAAAALPFDLGEVAMLGDSGAYVLGFVAGGGLLLRLSTPGVAVGLGVVVAVHILAETVTLSRLIRGFPPLRWLDDTGRLRHADLRPESSASS